MIFLMVIASVITALLGILAFLFIFWKRLKEDYASEVIFSTAFYVLLGLGFGLLAAWRFFPAWFFWTGFLGVTLGLTFAILRFRIRVYETLEAVVISFLPWLSLFFLKDSVVNSSIVSFVAFLVLLILVFVYYFLDSHYKEFSWYKSGKVGFAGLATVGLFFLARSGVAIFFSDVLSFLGKSEVLFSAVVAFTAFLLVLNLSRQE